MSSTPTIVANRSCDQCAMCCKVNGVAALEKPPGVWCQFCTTRKGCDNYDNRPQDCRDFYCGYLTEDWIGEEWQPRHSHMVLNFSPDRRTLYVLVDPQRPDVWRQAHYYNTLRQWARQAEQLGQGGHVLVSIRMHYYVVFPDRDVEIGPLAGNETIAFDVTRTPDGVIYNARKVSKPAAGV